MQSEIGNVSRACGLSEFRYVKFAPANFSKYAEHVPEQAELLPEHAEVLPEHAELLPEHVELLPEQIFKTTAQIQPEERLIEILPDDARSSVRMPQAVRFQLFAEIRIVTGTPTSMPAVPASGRQPVSTSRPLVAPSRRPARSVSGRVLKR